MSSLKVVFATYACLVSIAFSFIVASFFTLSSPPTPMPMSLTFNMVALAMIIGSMPVMTLAAYARQQARRIDALESQLRAISSSHQPE